MIKFEHPMNRLIKIAEGIIGSEVVINFAQVNDALGTTNFPDNKELPIEIMLDYRLGTIQILDILAHELAHIIAGKESEHEEKWQRAYEMLNETYLEKFQAGEASVLIAPEECKHIWQSLKACELCGLVEETK